MEVNAFPPILYRYMDNNGAIATLRTGNLRFSKVSAMNDLNEHEFRLARSTKKEVSEYIQNHRSENVQCMLKLAELGYEATVEWMLQYFNDKRNMLPQFSATKEQTYICCFCETFCNMRLWNGYAVSGRNTPLQKACAGAILGFEELDQFKDVLKIIYKSDAPLLSAIDLVLNRHENILPVFITKHHKWRNENEWRVIKPYDNEDVRVRAQDRDLRFFEKVVTEDGTFYDFCFNNCRHRVRLKNVYLGSQISPSDKDCILSLVAEDRYLHVDVYEMQESLQQEPVLIRKGTPYINKAGKLTWMGMQCICACGCRPSGFSVANEMELTYEPVADH